MPSVRLIIVPLALTAANCPAAAQDAAPPSDVDYPGFLALTASLVETREAHLLEWADWKAMARENDALILDTRSAAAFAAGHIEGAVNLPFSDFTSENLTALLGEDFSRAILIYCNNNFSDNVEPVKSKRIELALNIPTFVNLHGYGYTNVWELAELVSIRDPRIGWTAGTATES